MSDLSRDRLSRDARRPGGAPGPRQSYPAAVGRLAPGPYGGAPPAPALGHYMAVNLGAVTGAETPGVAVASGAVAVGAASGATGTGCAVAQPVSTSVATSVAAARAAGRLRCTGTILADPTKK